MNGLTVVPSEVLTKVVEVVTAVGVCAAAIRAQVKKTFLFRHVYKKLNSHEHADVFYFLHTCVCTRVLIRGHDARRDC